MSNDCSEFLAGLFSLHGRSNRTRYWTVIGLSWLALIVAGSLAKLAEARFSVAMAPAVLLILASMPIGVFNCIRRFHDLGRSGWWLVAPMLVYAFLAVLAEPSSPPGLMALGLLAEVAFGLGFIIVLGVLPGQASPNRFGEPPGRTAAAQDA